MSVHSKKDHFQRELVSKTKVFFTVKDFNVDVGKYESEVIAIGSNEWKIGVYTKWQDEEGIQWFGIELKLFRSSEDSVSAKFDSFVVDCNYDLQCHDFGAIDEYSFDTSDDNAWTYYTTRRDDFIANRNTLFANNCLTIGLDIEVYSDVIDCKEYFNLKHFSDFEIMVGEKKFYVWKEILSSQSDVLQKQLANDLQQNNCLVIDDIDSEVFEEFLKYLYFGYSGRLDQLKDKLLGISDKYQVFDLKTICENLMWIEINPKNAIPYLNAFHEFNCNAMKDKAIGYVVDNWSQIRGKSSNELSQLLESHRSDSNTYLTNDVVQAIATKMDSYLQKNVTDNCLKMFTFYDFSV